MSDLLPLPWQEARGNGCKIEIEQRFYYNVGETFFIVKQPGLFCDVAWSVYAYLIANMRCIPSLLLRAAERGVRISHRIYMDVFQIIALALCSSFPKLRINLSTVSIC